MNARIMTFLIALCVILSISISRVYILYRNQKSEKENVLRIHSKQVAETQIYKNKYGKEVTKNEAIRLESGTIKDMIRDGALQEFKQLEGLHRRMNNLEFAYNITARALDSIKVQLQDTSRYYINSKGDTIIFQAKDFTYQDKWVEFKAVQFSPDSSVLDYYVTVPLTGAMYWKRKWFFGRKEYFSEIVSENPHVVIPELVNIKVGRRKN